jgi:hypothetical protein
MAAAHLPNRLVPCGPHAPLVPALNANHSSLPHCIDTDIHKRTCSHAICTVKLTTKRLSKAGQYQWAALQQLTLPGVLRWQQLFTHCCSDRTAGCISRCCRCCSYGCSGYAGMTKTSPPCTQHQVRKRPWMPCTHTLPVCNHSSK